jgi:coenzyme PQQ synthesis protein D (PqqD)
VGALKDDDDLVAEVASRYTLDREQAQSDVAALLKGRRI